MSKSRRYEPKTPQQKIGYLIEECGELLAAIGKTLRWGLESSDPTSRAASPETNREWVEREIKDVERAIAHARGVLRDYDSSVLQDPDPRSSQ